MGTATIYFQGRLWYSLCMPRIGRISIANYVYHVLNRANARVQIFDDENDYLQFENILKEAVERFNMRLLAYCIMPNHWHLVVYPRNDKDLSLFMSWITNTHTRRWHTTKKMIGHGHLYQGRYKSFICQTDDHFLILVRYVERNAKRARLVQKAEDWRWSSIWTRENGTDEQQKFLSEWPIQIPNDYLNYVNESETSENLDVIRRSVIKNIPFGSETWLEKIVKKFKLGQTLRGVGRPKK